MVASIEANWNDGPIQEGWIIETIPSIWIAISVASSISGIIVCIGA